MPSTVEERAGGTATNNFGPGMESVATIKTWNPPHNFIAETTEPPIGTVATEWIVEARGQGTCVVRVVHRWFANTDDWDNQFEGHTHGWQAFFRILRLYLTHFSGQPCSAIQLTGFSTAPAPQVWRRLTRSLGIQADHTRITPDPATPPFSGVIEKFGDEANPEVLLRLDEPVPGLAHMFVMPMGGQVLVSIRFYLYGAEGQAAAATTERLWGTWLTDEFYPRGAVLTDPGA